MKNQGRKRSKGKTKVFNQKEILDFLAKNSPRSFKAKELAQQLNISLNVYQQFRKILKQLVIDGKVIRFNKGKFGLARKMGPEIIGELHVKTQGYGFVRRDDGGDSIFVSMKNMGKALHRDRVRVQLLAQMRGENPEGVVVGIVQRARSQIVGIYRKGRRFGFVTPDDLKIKCDIYVADADTGNAKSGQKVVVEILNWDNPDLHLEGRVTNVLGYPDEAGVAVEGLVHSLEIPVHFPQKVENQVAEIPDKIPNEEIARRLDLRKEQIFTIDPVDSKDFDDAVSLKKLDNGNWFLGVHIADVSYYVKEGTAVDQEALKRGTSVYLVDRVIPMLPEKLSNRICSLQPKTERLAYSVLMELTPKAEVVKYDFQETIIKSQRRFTYQEVQAILIGETKNDPYFQVLTDMNSLAKTLAGQRSKMGSLDFDIPEPEITLDAAGKPVSIRPRERLDSHRLVEDFMLLANRVVAEHVNLHMKDEEQKPVPFVFRIHEKPDVEKIKNFIEFVRALGFELTEQQARRPKSLQKFLSGIAEKQTRKSVNQILLRSLMKARYTTNNVGHFGLAFKHYTHFTSPIRRYPDLMVHRMLKRYLISTNIEDRKNLKKHLENNCKISSEQEIRALEAERESIKIKQLEFIEQYVGEAFDGVVAGVVPFGIFVEIPQFLVEGLVHVNDLEPDFFVLDEKRYQLIGQNSGKIYGLGDPVQIRIARVDRNEKLVDFTLATAYRHRRDTGKNGNGAR